MSPPIPTLTVTANNSLSVSFDKPMNFSLSASDISVEIQDQNDLTNPVIWTAPSFQDAHTMMVDLAFESTYLPSGSVANLTFLSVADVKDEYGVSINASSLLGPLHAFGSPPSNQTSVLLQTTTAQQTAAATKGGISAGAVSSLINANPACLVSLVNQLQLISYISMTELPIPPDFAGALAALNVGNMLPNPLPNLISINETSQVAPQFVQDYGINSTLFISNSATFIGTSCAIILSFLPIYLLSKMKVKFIANYFGKMLPSLRWNVPLTLWLTSYLDIGIFSLLQLLNARNSISTVLEGVSLVLAGLFVLCIGATPILLILFTYTNFSLMSSRSDPQFNKRWGFLYQGFKADAHFSSIAYYCVFIVRRFTLVLTLTVGQDYLGFLALLNTSFGFVESTIQFFLYIAVCRPYESKLDQTEAILIEGCTCAIYVSASSFLLDLSLETRDVINQAGVWLVRLAIFSNVSMSVARTCLTVSDLLKAYARRMRDVKLNYRLSQVAQTRKDQLPDVSEEAEDVTLHSELSGNSYLTIRT